MAKFVPNNVLDLSLDQIATATRMLLCSSQPTDYASADAAKLAQVTMAPADFSKSTPVTGTRRLTIAEKLAVSVLTTGTGNHIAYVRVADTTLLGVTTCPSVAVTAGGNVNFPTHNINVTVS